MKGLSLVPALLVGAAVCAGAQPARFNYQASLTDSEGAPLAGVHTIFFSVHKGGSANTPDSGTELYAETVALTPDNGVVSHVVGSGTPTTGSLSAPQFTGTESYYLEVAVDTAGNVILPRTLVVPVPFALSAQNAGQVAPLLPVAAGNSIAKGNAVSFVGGGVQKGFSDSAVSDPGTAGIFNPASGGTSFIQAAPLSATTFVVAYRDDSVSGRGTAAIGTVSGDTVSFGAETPFETGNAPAIGVASLSSTKFAVSYSDFSESQRGKVIIGTVSGSTITFGSQFVFHSGGTGSTAIVALNSSTLAIAYNDGDEGGAGKCLVATVSGTNVTTGSEFTFNPGGTSNIAAAPLSSGQFIVAYADSGNSIFGTAAVCSVSSGTVVTTGPETVFNPGITGTGLSSYAISAVALDASNVLIAYVDQSNGSRASVVLGSVSGNSVTFGSEFDVTAGLSGAISAARLSVDEVALAYRPNNSIATAAVATIANGAVTFSPGVPVFPNAGDIEVVPVTAAQVSVCYMNDTNNRGEARMATVSAGGSVLGVAGAAGTAGQSIPVIIDGVSDAQSGLSAGRIYYANRDGTLSFTNPTLPRVGQALSATELILQTD